MFVRSLAIFVAVVLAGFSTQVVAGACGSDRDLQRMAAQARAYAAGQAYFPQRSLAMSSAELDQLCAESPEDIARHRAAREAQQSLQARAYASGDNQRASLLATVAHTQGEALMSDTQ